MTASEDSLELAVYACSADALLFVPALLLPPDDAEAAFGPLARLGTVHVSDGVAAWQMVIEQIERHLFATVSRAEAELLVGLRGASAHAGGVALR